MSSSRYTLDPKLDIVFWMLFARDSSRELLVSLLTAVLAPTTPITHVELLNPEFYHAAIDEKGIVLDLRVMLGSGEQVDIEMQSRPHRALKERILYYWARLYAEQMKRGAEYTELRRTIGVLFQNFSSPESPRFHSVFRICEDRTRVVFSDQLELHVVELPQVGRGETESAEPLLMLWCKFLSATTDSELEALVSRPGDAFRISDVPDGARTSEILSMHQSGLGTLPVPVACGCARMEGGGRCCRLGIN